MKPLQILATIAFSLAGLAATASAQTADFDTFSEGTFATTMTDGGITFSNMNNGLGGTQNFTIDEADGDLTGMPGFTTPMTMGFGGWSPGPHVGFGRIISFDFSTSQTADTASIEIFELGSYAGNSITLEARSGSTVVGSQTVPIQSGFSIHHYSLSVSGVTFDHLHVVGSGPSDSGAFFAAVDHVIVTSSGSSAFCFGDGTGAACPCSNSGSSGHGCQNSAGTGGAELTFSGTTNPDTIVLAAVDELPSAFTIFLQGDAQMTNALHFGDGLRCVGGHLKRLYAHNASGGAVHGPDASMGDLPITTRSAALGDPIAPGSTRYYQTYYRDPSGTFCPPPAGDTFNASNAVAITW
jgi:hypothetical protein